MCLTLSIGAEHGLTEHQEVIRKGAQVAAAPVDFDELEDLTEEEKAALRLEFTNKWKQPKQLWLLVISCSMAAVVQGQDQSLINGSNIFWPQQFGLGVGGADNPNIFGLINVGTAVIVRGRAYVEPRPPLTSPAFSSLAGLPILSTIISGGRERSCSLLFSLLFLASGPL